MARAKNPPHDFLLTIMHRTVYIGYILVLLSHAYSIWTVESILVVLNFKSDISFLNQ